MKKHLSLIAAAMLLSGTAGRVSAGGTAVVPNVNGECTRADQIIKRAGLKPKAVAVHGPVDQDAGGIGCAYRQHPKAGTKVKRGSTVTYRFWWESS